MNKGYALEYNCGEYILYYNDEIIAVGKDIDYVMSFYKEEKENKINNNINIQRW